MAISVKQFLKQLEDSGILDGDTIKEVVPPKSTLKDAEELAIELVRRKKLTRFQAEQLCLGQAKSLLLGNYLLMEKIGTGGMGQVYKALHRRMGRIVAVKLLTTGADKDEATIARFEREVKTVAKLSHPNIVSAYDADYANGLHFLVMEFVEGRDLSAWVKKNGPFCVERALNYILQAAKGLEAAHAQRIVHRDIKPANLFLDKNGIVKVLDLGIARLTENVDGSHYSDLTSTSMVIGTVEYMAPEQALDTKAADARADIYALGCSLFYLLTGRSIYEGNTLMKKIVAHRETPIPTISDIRRDVDEQVEGIYKKMVAKQVEDRYQTMSEVIDAIETYGRTLNLNLNIPQPISSPVESSETAQVTLANRNSHSAPTIPSHANKKTRLLPPKGRKKFVLTGGGIIGILILLSVLIVNLKTKEGTLIVTVNEPDAEVQVVEQAGKIEITRKGEKGPTTITVDPGKHRLKVSKDGFELFTKDFEIQSGGKQLVTVKLVPVLEKPQIPVSTAVQNLIKKKQLAFELPGFDQWTNEVGALFPDKQLEAVSKKLIELNPGFDGKLTDGTTNEPPKIVDGAVTELGFDATEVTDISPVRALAQLKTLTCIGKIGRGRLWDLSPIKGMSLTFLNFASTRVCDLSPLRGMKLLRLNCSVTAVSDLSPLQGMALTLFLASRTDVADLSPLQGMPIATLYCDQTDVTDFSPLREMNLSTVNLTPKNITKGIGLIRRMSSLRMIRVDGGTPIPSSDFWSRYDAGEFGGPMRAKTTMDINDSIFQQWMKEVVILPADKQVEAVSQKLVELNPGFDGKVTDFSGNGAPKIENGVVTEFGFLIDKVTDISPVRALADLRDLNCHISRGSDCSLTDLSPLKGMNLLNLVIYCRSVRDLSPLEGMPLNTLNCQSCPIKDLSPLKGMPLKRLGLSDTKVSDLSPLEGMKLTALDINSTRVKDISVLKEMPIRTLKFSGTQVEDLSPIQRMPLTALVCQFTEVSDLSPLKGLPIVTLHCFGSPITDLSPLQGINLKEFYFSPDQVTAGLDVVRQSKTIETIGLDTTKRWSPAEFWQKFDAGEFGIPASRPQ